jgi:hypothetical protein
MHNFEKTAGHPIYFTILVKSAQQSMRLTLGILRQSQAVFYALAFFQLDGFAVFTHMQVTQTVSPPSHIINELQISNSPIWDN